jgi:3',5'-cyclic AMP phosphodiesterase CpdA
MEDKPLNRRQFLKIAGLGALGSVGLYSPTQFLTPESAARRRRVLRIAHITDIHYLPYPEIYELAAQALRHAQGLSDPPDIFINTGDTIMDSLEQPKDFTEWQWQGFMEMLQAECHLPIYHAIGNHDVWGWGLKKRKIKDDPLYGPNMAIAKLGLPNRYYSFDLAGWHFAVLDSNHPPNKVSDYPYIGQLDEDQFQWLVGDIQATSSETPICIVSHIPILAACEYFDGPNEESGNWVIPAAWVHIDARRFRQLFLEHPNVRLCLSGHTHQYESLDYLGVRYLTDGAICGAWWEGAYLDFPPAYVLVDLYEDGSARSKFVPYQEG